MQDIPLGTVSRKFLLEAFQRNRRIVIVALHLNRNHIVPRSGWGLGKQEFNFNAIAIVLSVAHQSSAHYTFSSKLGNRFNTQDASVPFLPRAFNLVSILLLELAHKPPDVNRLE